MEDNQKFSDIVLSHKTYRNLQQMAKSMGLPSNVKKKYLIELIAAKKFKTAKELDEIVHRVKQERIQLSKAKKGKLRKNSVQGTEISSTSNSSPPISSTPKILKRSKAIMTYSRERNSLERFKSTSAIRTFQSDRVLRSFTRPNYRIYNMNNTVIGLIKGENAKPARINIISQDGRCPKFNVTAVLKSASDPMVSSNQVMSFYTNPSQPEKRLAITTNQTEPRKPLTPTVNITNRDGRTAKINALVHKPNRTPYTYSELSLLKRDLKIEQPHNETTEFKASTSILGCDVTNHECYEKRSLSKENFSNVTDRGLPRITEVFSKFNGIQQKNLMQPLYVQVSEDSERTISPVYTASVSHTNTSLLEKLYNFKDNFITNRPLNQLNCTKAKTQCVFSTPTITTPSQHPTIAGFNDFNASYDRDISYQSLLETIPRSYRIDDDSIFNGKEFNCDEVLSSSTSSIDTLSCEGLGGNTSIPEMVEDALELISQDGDYMERIGMNDKMLCLICSWAGPKLMLEHHIRKDHSSDIHKRDNSEWNVTFTLGSVVQRDVWLCRLFENNDIIYVVSAKYEDPDCFMASLHALSTDETSTQTGRMTIYNKVSGEPYSWEGDINELPDGMPYANDADCLKLSLAKMNLLPNRANLQLINRELVVKSPTKVVVGQPELNEIHIILFVKIMT